jgi:hypothetical protein
MDFCTDKTLLLTNQHFQKGDISLLLIFIVLFIKRIQILMR